MMFLCNFLYLIFYRYSKTINSSISSSLTTTTSSFDVTINDINNLLNELNDELKLNKLVKKAFTAQFWPQLFYLVILVYCIT